MIKKLMLIATLASISGCMAIEPVKFNGPSGKTAYSMKCNGMGRTLDDCYVKAGEVCPSGYSIIDRSTGYARVNNIGVTTQTIAIECK